MSLLAQDSETFVDLDGKPVGADVCSFLRALDRLLTVGAYYADDHEQYLRAAQSAWASMVAAIRPRASFTLEVTASGLVADGAALDPRQRGARQVHDLMVSLDVATLDFSAGMTAADLRQALAALHAHRQSLGHTRSFRALTVNGLPSTISAASRRVVVATPTAAGDDDPLDTLLDAWSERTGPAPAPAGAVRDDFLHDLMAVLQQASENLAEGRPAAGDAATATITQDELAAIRQGVERLLERDPEAGEIAHLMDLARQALALSGDPGKARLVFDQLRRTVDADPSASPCGDFGDGPCWPVGELSARVAELAARESPCEEPLPSSRRDQVAIGFRLLAGGPGDNSFKPALALLQRACGAAGFGAAEASVAAGSIVALARDGRRDVIDEALPALLGDLRATRPDLLAQLWCGLDDDLEPAALEVLWPHLANDLILGFGSAPESAVARCCLLAGALDVDAALDLAPRLRRLPGAGRECPSDQVFAVPPVRAAALHAALLRLPAAELHGPRLYREMLRRPADALSGIVTAAVEGCDAADADLLLALLREGGRPAPSPDFMGLAASLLLGVLDELPAARRGEPWTAPALRWLAGAAPVRVRPLLERVAGERRWLVRSSWPEACRAVAAAALAGAPAGREGG